MNHRTERLSGVIRVAVIGISIGCLTLAGCTSSPPAGSASPPSTPAITEDPATTTESAPPASTPTESAPERTATRPAPPGTPEQAAEVVAPAPRIGPHGFGGLRLGMTFQQAKSAGFVRGNESQGSPCAMYDMYFGGQNFGMVFISADRGVESIAPTRPVRTPEGVTFGTSADRLVATYPQLDRTLIRELGHVGVRVPGNPAATYRFSLRDHNEVEDISLQRSDQQCYE